MSSPPRPTPSALIRLSLLALCLLSVALPAAEPPSTGVAHAALKPFDELMARFLEEHRVAGAALAVTKDGRLVYARGHGLADLETKEPVEPDALFRIASVSKPITAVAVLQLVEKGKLALDDKVGELLAIEPHVEAGAELDPRLRDITILQLLQHTGGFDRDVSFDPMFRAVEIAESLGVVPPAGPAHVIRFMWGRPLDFNPGERYAYSNFGYCLLGRVIEKATGAGYADAVQREVLAPLGIRDMRIGRTLLEERAPREVRYHSPRRGPAVIGEIGAEVPSPYGCWYLEAMDAHGAWIASAVDLVRFAAAFDRPSASPLLSEASIATMFARPQGRAGTEEDGSPADSYYGCGWKVRPKEGGGANHWHAGSLPGTSTLLVRRHDGLCWAVLFNERNSKTVEDRGAGRLSSIIDPLLHEAADAVAEWPQHDEFERFGVGVQPGADAEDGASTSR